MELISIAKIGKIVKTEILVSNISVLYLGREMIKSGMGTNLVLEVV